MDEQIRHILEILENDARASPEEIAALTKMSAQEVSQTIAKLEETGVIRHYKTIVDWDLVGENYVYAIIELKVILERNLGYQAIAEKERSVEARSRASRAVAHDRSRPAPVRSHRAEGVSQDILRFLTPELHENGTGLSGSRVRLICRQTSVF